MDTGTQAIFFFFGFLLCLLEAFIPLRTTPGIWGVRFGWLGLAAFIFVFFWIAISAKSS